VDPWALLFGVEQLDIQFAMPVSLIGKGALAY